MAVVEPYAHCPCGSGEKYKWCCQKVEPIFERASRLHESGQVQAALDAIEEGLRKFPDSFVLLINKAIYEIKRGNEEAARAPLERILRKNPRHILAQLLLTQLVLEREGPVAGVAQLQKAAEAYKGQP